MCSTPTRLNQSHSDTHNRSNKNIPPEFNINFIIMEKFNDCINTFGFFLQMHKIGNIGIIENFVLTYICNFPLYFGHISVVMMGLHFKVANFIGPVPF